MTRTTFKFNLWLAALLLLYALPAQAIGKRDIPVDRLENGERLEISPGYGLTINMMPIGKVNRAWLTDKSWMTIANENGACPNGGCGQSRFIYLQRIDKLDFDGLPSTIDGGTLLNLATVTGEILQFHVVRDRDGIPAYTSVYVQPEQEQEVAASTPPPSPIPVSTLTPTPSATLSPPPPVDDIPVEVLIDVEEENEPKQTTQNSDDIEIVVLEPEVEEESEKPSRPSQKPEQKSYGTKETPEADSERDEDLVTPVVISQTPEVKLSVEEKPKGEAIASTAKVESDGEKQVETSNREENEDEIKPSSVESDERVVLATTNAETAPEQTNQEIASALLRGLHSQRGRREVGRSIHYYKAQDLIYLLKRDPNLSLEQAIARARMDTGVAKALIRYGQR